MKKIFSPAIIVAILLASCQKPKDHVELYGKISHPNSDKITISNPDNGYKKEIAVNEDGSFSDTLKIKEGRYRFYDGLEYGRIFLKNGNTTSFTLDTNAFDETLKFKGDDADKSNVLIDYELLKEKHLNSDLFRKNITEFENAFNTLEKEFGKLKLNYRAIYPSYFEPEDRRFKKMKAAYLKFYKDRQALMKEFTKGTPSPTFENYENFEGGTTSLKNFRGKYVYIDIWATWCGPCKLEIPFLKELEERFHDRNIEFVSISVDDDRRSGTMEKAKTAWKTMVAEKNLTGVQLFTGSGLKADFIKAYKINSIPRFILIDPKGNIVDADAPRPSSAKITELLKELGI